MILSLLLQTTTPLLTANVSIADVEKDIIVDETTISTLYTDEDEKWELPDNLVIGNVIWDKAFKQPMLWVVSVLTDYKEEQKKEMDKEKARIEEEKKAYIESVKQAENKRIEDLYNSLPRGKVIDKYKLKVKTSKYTNGSCTSYPWHYFQLDKLNRTLGNAIEWYKNAPWQGLTVSETPIPESIIVFKNGRHWYHSLYWHVGIVKEVYDKYLVIEDMNYLGKFIVTKRIIPINQAIKGYIYPSKS